MLRTAIFSLIVLINLSESFDNEHVYRIVEEVPVGHLIGSFHSIGFSSIKLQYQYNIVSKDLEIMSLFEISKSDGDLRTKSRIDRDTLCSDKRLCCTAKMSIECEIKFRVIMRNDESELNWKYIRVRIIVEDINDNVPKFTNSALRLEISESTTVGTMLFLPLAIDEDFGKNSIQLYVLKSDSSAFRLVTATIAEVVYPRLELIDTVDRETVSRYHMTLCAQDGGRPMNTGCIKIDLFLTDSNDNPPIINQQSLNFKVPKNFVQLEKIGTILASDKDEGNNALLRYYVSDLAPLSIRNKISIDANNGDIRLIQKLNYDSIQTPLAQMIVPIQVTDSGSPSLTATSTLTIHLEDTNDDSPVITITDLKGKIPPRPQITENKLPGQVAAFVHVVDADQGLNGHVDCNLQDSQYFRLVVESGQRDSQEKEFKIESKQSLDREMTPTIDIVLVCADKGTPSRTTTQTVAIVIADENDNYPIFNPNPIIVSIMENVPINTLIVNLNVTDADHNSPVTCTMDPEEHEYISIDRHSCSLHTKRTIDRELIEKIIAQVVAVDKGSPSKQTVAQLFISILDENDNKPDFHRKLLEYRVKESQEPTIIAKIIAQDPDDDKNGEVTYQLSFHDNAAHIAFGIDPISGNLYTKTRLDREKRSSYEFEVIAMDNGRIRLASSATVKVIVDDINDNNPKLIYPSKENRSHSFSVYNIKGTQLIKVTATDLDEGLNKDIIYEIVSGNQNGVFQLDPSTGQIYLARDLQMKDAGTYTIKIEARDNGEPSLKDFGILQITFDSRSKIIPTFDHNRRMIHKFRSELDEQGSIMFGRNIMLIICVTFVALLAILVFLIMIFFMRRKSSTPCENNASKTDESQNKFDPVMVALNQDQINITNNNLWSQGYNTLQMNGTEKLEDQYFPLSPTHSMKCYGDESSHTYQRLIRRNDNVLIQMSPLCHGYKNSATNSPLLYTNRTPSDRDCTENLKVVHSPGLSIRNRNVSTTSSLGPPITSKSSNEQLQTSSFV